MPSWSPTNRRPRRSCWIWMRATTRSMARGRPVLSRLLPPLLLSPAVHLRLLCARLRCSNIDGAAGSVEELERIVGRIWQSWPEVSIVIRADSGFCRDDLLRWCEDHHVDYVMGLANNDRLKKERRSDSGRSRVQRHRDTGAGVQGFPLPDSPQLDLGATARQGRVLCAGRHGEPHKRTAVVRANGCICPPSSCTPCVGHPPGADFSAFPPRWI